MGATCLEGLGKQQKASGGSGRRAPREGAGGPEQPQLHAQGITCCCTAWAGARRQPPGCSSGKDSAVMETAGGKASSV